MRLLLDESVPRRLRRYLPDHAVSTVVEMGWGGTKNGALLKLAAVRFDAFITVDQNLPYQQNAMHLPLPVIVLAAKSNALADLLRVVSGLKNALAGLQAGLCLAVSG
ncbi:MAG: DUF5615 family PIN-like protein [Pseudomonadota bacterium]|nr:DUF5615 family PIN-like protein [Pseudomonadota bacterium]